MIIKLSWPDSKLLPNRKNGRHWTSSQSAKENARLEGYQKAKDSGYTAPDGLLPVTLVFCAPDKRRRDLDNLLAAMKPALDGIAAALEVDDSRFRPVTIDMGEIAKPGCVIVGIGVELYK